MLRIFLCLLGLWLSFKTVDARPSSLTPPSPATPQIHGARIFGVHPGNPFLFTVAATGQRPMKFLAEGLPDTLDLDAASGQITGKAPAAGDYHVTLQATNALGTTQRDLLIKVGDHIALTPPMGWNSWNCFAGAVSEEKVKSAADAMVKSGLADHGWTYINVDDFWQVNPKKGRRDASLAGPERNADGSIHPNARFPDMKGLADYVHARGLKAGLYSSPGPYTCGGCTGSYQHEAQDAGTYATWGFDYLKYDWCSYEEVYRKQFGGQGIEGMKKPYQAMAAALAGQPRDLVYSFCQYGMGDVWKWGAATGGNSWRTTSDIGDNWQSMWRNGQRQVDLAPYAGPGHWNDPDMLVVGKVGWGPNLHATHLTPDEQYTEISLWSLQAAPLLIGCDLTQLDPFTLGLLTNDEVLDVDQDPLGKAAGLVSQPVTAPWIPVQIWARPLFDGSIAVGFFNITDTSRFATLDWSDFMFSSLHPPEAFLDRPHQVRDLWRQKDLGTFDHKFETQVPAHGVVLVKVSKT